MTVKSLLQCRFLPAGVDGGHPVDECVVEQGGAGMDEALGECRPGAHRVGQSGPGEEINGI